MNAMISTTPTAVCKDGEPLGTPDDRSSDSSAILGSDTETTISENEQFSSKLVVQPLNVVVRELYDENIVAKILKAAVAGLESNVRIIKAIVMSNFFSNDHRIPLLHTQSTFLRAVMTWAHMCFEKRTFGLAVSFLGPSTHSLSDWSSTRRLSVPLMVERSFCLNCYH
jgi:hypothetical protein